MRTITAIAAVLFAAAAAGEGSSSQQCPELIVSNAAVIAPPVSQSTCANGDFESGLDTKQWSGRHGVVLHDGRTTFLASGLSGGPLDSCDAHQTLVETGIDPIAGISTVAPGGSSRAVRIGNSAVNSRAESFSKTFVVEEEQSVIHFSYAVVFQDPEHKDFENPSFEVRVVDGQGNVIGNVVDLGDGKCKLIADADRYRSVGGLTVVQDWSCGRIDLSDHVRETVTVEFITEDCSRGAHFAYAYVDEFCGGGGCGPTFELEHADECGAGRICFRAGGATPGDRPPLVELTILQTGEVLMAPTPNGDVFCFVIDPARFEGEAFDYAATATFFTEGGRIVKRVDGTEPYFLSCGTRGCCDGVNLIANGDVEAGNRDFSSEYMYAAGPYVAAAVPPGRYAVLNAAEALAVAPTWTAQSHTACDDTAGRFLAINGQTRGAGARVVWSQRVEVVPDTDYRFCVNVRNFPQCAFDVLPRIELHFNNAVAGLTETIDVRSTNPCDWTLVSRDLHVPPGVGSLLCEIRLLDDNPVDGNDLALDDVSLQKLAPGDRFLAVALTASAVTGGAFTIASTAVAGTPEQRSWEICEAEGPCVMAPELSTFRFDASKVYRLTYTVDGDCITPAATAWRVEGGAITPLGRVGIPSVSNSPQ